MDITRALMLETKLDKLIDSYRFINIDADDQLKDKVLRQLDDDESLLYINLHEAGLV